jgi:hypothetical protein
MTILSGHDTPETAYIVTDYPYGFRLRCNMRYWLEHNPKAGTRLWSQTTNPKKPEEIWNKPKASTYQPIAGVMLQNDEDHITWTGLNFYSELKEAIEFREMFYDYLHEMDKDRLDKWIACKELYEEKKEEGKNWQEAGRETAFEAIKAGIEIPHKGRY